MSINTVKKDLRLILGLVTGIIPIVSPVCSIIVIIMKKQFHYILFPVIVLAFSVYYLTYKPVNRYEQQEDLKENVEERILAIEFDPSLLKIDDLLHRRTIIRNNIYEKIYSEISDLVDLEPWNRDGRKDFRNFIDSFSSIFDHYSSNEKDIIYTENNTIKITPQAYNSHNFHLNYVCNDYIDMIYPVTWIEEFGILIAIALWVGMFAFNMFVFTRLF